MSARRASPVLLDASSRFWPIFTATLKRSKTAWRVIRLARFLGNVTTSNVFKIEFGRSFAQQATQKNVLCTSTKAGAPHVQSLALGFLIAPMVPCPVPSIRLDCRGSSPSRESKLRAIFEPTRSLRPKSPSFSPLSCPSSCSPFSASLRPWGNARESSIG